MTSSWVLASWGAVLGIRVITAVVPASEAWGDRHAATPGIAARSLAIVALACFASSPEATTSSGPLKPGPKEVLIRS